MPGASEFLKKKPVITAPTPPPETPVEKTQQQDPFDFSRFVTDPRDNLIETTRDNLAFLKSQGNLGNDQLLEPYINPATGKEDPGSRYQPTTEELNTLDAYGLLFDPASDNMPLYPLTKEFKLQDKNPLIGAAGLGLEVAFGAFEEGIRQGRVSSEKTVRGITGGWTEQEAELYKYYMDQFKNENGREPDRYEERLIFDKSFNAPGINLPFSKINVPFTDMTIDDYDFTGRSAFTLAGELIVPMKYVDDVFGVVLKGGVKGIKYVNGKVFPSSKSSDTPGIAPDTIIVINKPKDNPFDMPEIKTSFTKQEQARTSVIDNSSTKRIENTVTKLYKLIKERGIERGESLGATISNSTDRQMKNVFQFDKRGGIISLPKDEFGFHPTIADAAADLQRYSTDMNPEQLNAFLKLKERLAPIGRAQEEAGVKISIDSRHDIKEGGFFVPRGATFDATVETTTTGAGRSRGSSSHLKAATMETQVAGQRANYEYKSFRDAVNDYIKDSGIKTSGAWTQKMLNNVKDLDGKPIATTLEARLAGSPVVTKGRELVNKIYNNRQKLFAAEVRARTLTKTAKKAEIKKSRVEERADRELEKLAREEKATLEQSNIETVQAAFNRLEAEDAVRGGRNSTPEGREFRALVKEAKLVINSSIADGQKLVRAAQINARRAQDLNAAEKKLVRQVIKLADELDEIVKESAYLEDSISDTWFLNTTQSEIPDMYGLYNRLIKTEQKLNNKIDEADFKFDVLEERLEEAETMKALLDEESAVQVQKRQNANQVLRKSELVERQLARLQSIQRMKELEQKHITKRQRKLSNRDLNRINRQITEAGGEADKVENEAIETWIRVQELVEEQDAFKIEYEDIANELNVARTKARSEAGKGKAFVNMPELNGTSFPDRLAQSMNEVMEKEMRARGKGTSIIRGYISYNRLFRQLTATGDDSALWIHGVLRAADDPKGTAQDFLWHLKAYQNDGDKILGAYINDFDEKALNMGRLTSDGWAQYGLRVGGVDTEYQLGVGVTKILASVPGVKLSNRLFGFLGDRMRLEMANGEIDRLLLEGRTLDEIKNSDLIYEITDAANSATGYSSRKYGGDIADMVTYAPRFFQARIENLYRASLGIAKDPAGAVIEAVPGGRAITRNRTTSPLKVAEKERVARRAMLRLLSGAVTLTYAANATRGYETDLNLFSKDNKGNWNYNTNFLRIQNIFGQDVSLLGPYDSLIKLLIATGSGTYHLGRGGDPLAGLKGLAAGPISQVSELLSDQAFDGTPLQGHFIPGTQLPEEPNAGDIALAKIGWFIESFLPFASEGLLRTKEFVDKGEVDNAIAALPASYYAVKSSPLSYTDTVKLVAQELIQEDVESPTATEDGPRWGFQNFTPLNPFDKGFKLEYLSRGEREIIFQDPRVQAALEKIEAKVPDDLSKAFDSLEENFIANEEDLIKSIEADAYPSVIAGLVQNLKFKNSEDYKNFEQTNQELLEEKEKINETKFEVRADYWGNRMREIELEIDIVTGFIDYKKFEEDRDFVVSLAAEEDERFKTYLEGTGPGTYSGEKYQDERVRAVVQEYDTFLNEIARPYYEKNIEMAEMIGVEKEYQKYLESPNKANFTSPLLGDSNLPIVDTVHLLAQQQQIAMRVEDPLLEAYLYMYDLFSGLPVSKLVNDMIAELREESGSEQIDTRRIKDYIDQGFFEGPQYD